MTEVSDEELWFSVALAPSADTHQVEAPLSALMTSSGVVVIARDSTYEWHPDQLVITTPSRQVVWPRPLVQAIYNAQGKCLYRVVS